MRIIAGEWRSRTLHAPRGMATRPTSDRLRETLFNVLAPRIEGARFADLFAGSGAVGLEALSRGAQHCVFVEKAAPAFAALKRNLAELAVPRNRYTLLTRDVAAEVRAGAVNGCDIIFLDPPYEDAAAYANTLEALSLAPLAPDTVVIAEHAAPRTRRGVAEPAARFDPLERTRLLTQGDAALSFYCVTSAHSRATDGAASNP